MRNEYVQTAHNPKPFKRLTPQQNQIIYALQQGWVLITSSDSNYVTCGSARAEFQFGAALFWRLYNMGLIGQRGIHPWDYTLTTLGRETKTRPIDLTPQQ
jgi:hypothetical protein